MNEEQPLTNEEVLDLARTVAADQLEDTEVLSVVETFDGEISDEDAQRVVRAVQQGKWVPQED